ncbi:MAG: hypothetical protein JRI48_07770 [Deltaproteobacteria bacterium]|nr:hypothetical protein [Deltaproteobacteria bacterium]
MKIVSDGFHFDFTDALNVFIFDEKDKSKPTYHGLPMKAVDLIAEFPDAYVFVEMKDFDDPDFYNQKLAENDEEEKEKRDHFRWLKNYLKYKYRDTYLFRHAENKVDKPIHYICLLTFDNALNTTMQKALWRELPVGLASRRWKWEIVKSCHVVNLARWNENFPKWPMSRSVGAGGEA